MPPPPAQLVRGALVVLDQGIYSITTFAATVMVARSSGSAELAYFALAQTLLMSGLIVLRCLVGVPFTVLCAGMDQERRAEYWSASMIGLAAFALVGAVIVSAVALAVAHDRAFSNALFALGLAGPMVFLRDFLRSSFLAAFDVARSFKMSAFSNAFALGLMVFCAWRGELTAAMALTFIGAGAALPVFKICIAEIKWQPRRVLRTHARENWQFGRHTLLANGLSVSISQAVPWLVFTVDTREAVAQLAAALSIAGLLRPVTQGVAAYLTPVLARRYVEGGRALSLATSRRVMRLMAVFSLTFVAGMAVLGGMLIEVVYGVRLHDAWLLTLVTISVAVESIAVVLRATVRAIHEPAEETVAAGVGAIVGAAVAGLMVPTLGAIGGAAAIATSQCAFVVTSLIRIQRTSTAPAVDDSTST